MENRQVIPRLKLRRLEAETALGRQLAEEVMGVRPELKATEQTITTLKGRFTGLVMLGANLLVQMAESRARLGTNWQNSSTPPSSDGPGAPPRPNRKPTGRLRGGQPGHAGKSRALVAAADVDEAYSMWPDEWSSCKAVLNGDDPDPLEHQVVEIPDPKVIVSAYLLHALTCTKLRNFCYR